jgi:hypothetical protein
MATATATVRTLDGRQYAVIDTSPGLISAARLPIGYQANEGDVIEYQEHPDYEGAMVEILHGGRWERCRVDWFAERRAGENLSDVADRLGIEEENFL